ncbi:MAG TPA: SusC/RagA family TonB-linked outer membrane protein [Longimicrobiaceae bacterium]|nr:SusC/RagA family TonB-linked outer membrane protein [Longimicrobiaceae bacterium]
MERLSLIRTALRAALAAALLGATAVPLASQAAGTVRGTVTDATTQRPLPGVRVAVANSTRAAVTDAAGAYALPGVPAGTVRLRAQVLGYSAGEQTVTVAAGGTATANFALAPSAIQIEGIVGTVTGENQRIREVGSSVATIRPRDDELAVSREFTQLLTARAPGLLVQSTAGTTGTTSRVRLRGSNSVSLANDPLLIVDGVRVDNNPASMSIGLSGQTVSRWNDINPEEVESVEVLKGPAGVALYGTAAANGVIQVTTRRGRAGRARWNGYAETGSVQQAADIPLNYAQVGVITIGHPDFDGLRWTDCNLDNQAQGICQPLADSLYAYSPLVGASPFRDGPRYASGLSVSGGGEQATYFLSGDYEQEDGVVVDNWLRRVNLRANLRGRIAEQLTVDVTSGYVSSRLRLPFGDNTSFGAYANGIRGQAFRCSPQDPCVSGGIGTEPLDSTSLGYSNGFPPSEFDFIENRQDVERFIGGVTANWTALPWLTAVGVAGMDVNNRFDHQFIAPNVSQFNAAIAEGLATAVRSQIYTYTATGTLTARRELGTDLQSTTSLGAQYNRESFSQTTAQGAAIVPGTGGLGGASARFVAGEANADVVTLGGFAQQQLSWRDRLFVTASLRADDNSAFGQSFDLAYYPGLSLSWVVSEEPFFPAGGVLSSLRLRAAYGRSGQRPAFRQAETFFTGVSARVGSSDVPALTIGGTGNAQLRPEISSELEGGFDASFFEDRLGLELTFYDRVTRDALVARTLAPSLGVGANRFENLGRMTNRGVEALVRAGIIETAPIKLESTLTFAVNRNRVEALGEDIAPILFNFDNLQRHQGGYPAGSYFSRRIVSYQDLNGDGVISRVNCPTYGGVANPAVPGGPACEIVLSDTAEYLGQALPPRSLTLAPVLTLWDRVRIAALFDHRGGNVQYNSSEEFRCGVLSNCRGIHDRDAPLAEQAAAMARLMGSYDGYVQDASFWKWRELSLTLGAPQRLARRFGASELSLTLAGRNLKTWTDYGGVDPEVNSLANGNFGTADFDAQPPVRTWSARFNLSF